MKRRSLGRVVGNVVRRQLLAKHMSQNELARRAGVSQPAISRLIAGQRADPSSELLVAIADGLDLSLGQLVERIARPGPSANRPAALQEYIARARANRAQLRREGIDHLAIFGSVARGEQRPNSDIDVLIDLRPNRRYTLFDLGGISESLRTLFERDVDMVRRDQVYPRLRKRIISEAVRAF